MAQRSFHTRYWLLGAILCASLGYGSARAQVAVQVAGAVEVAPIPPSLDSGAFVSTTLIRLMHEGAGQVSAAMPPFAFDAAHYEGVFPGGTAVTTPAGGPGLPAPGTEVYSILLHFDPDVGGLPFSLTQGLAASGSLVFDRPILGAYVGYDGLSASDPAFGAATVFSSDDRRDLEFNYAGDVFAISPDRLEISFTLFAHNGGYFDEMRILLDAASPSPAGSVPDGGRVPGVPLRLARAGADQIQLSWGPSCAGDDVDYAIYEGALGDFASHVPVAGTGCTTGGATDATIAPAAGDTYYLVVPLAEAGVEGGYGFDGVGGPRPASPASCAPQQSGACPQR